MTTLWFGGWQGPGVDSLPLLGVLWFTLKVYVFVLIFMWVRATLPRLRIDQLMDFCWKVLIPMALVNVMATAVLLLAFPDTLWPVAVVNWSLVAALLFALPALQKRRLRAFRERARLSAA